MNKISFSPSLLRTRSVLHRSPLPFLAVAATLLLLTSCRHDSRPDGVISPLQMSEFLTEAYQIEAYNSILSPNNRDSISSNARAAYDELLQRQGLTKEQVDRSLDYYGHRPDQYEKILNDVLYRLEEDTQTSN